MRRAGFRVAVLLIIGAMPLAATGCFNPFRPLVSDEPAFVEPAPVPNTAQNVIRLFRWCWENRDDVKYREVFSADFEFAFNTTDSAGIPFRNDPWRREDELNAAHNLFVAGSATESPASSITLTLTPEDFRAENDLRPGKEEPWHQRIQVYVNLTVQKPDGAYQVTGDAIFYVVRGDSADIPEDLGPSFGPDPNRWYIERWEDLTGGATAATSVRPVGEAERPGSETLVPSLRGPRVAGATSPAFTHVTWGRLKAIHNRLR